jgi:hypothetical protein
MNEPVGCSTRSLALGGLAAYGSALVLFVLIFTVPALGRPADNGYLPPLLGPALLLGLFTIAVAFGGGVASCVTSIKTHRWGWACVFLLLSPLCFFGPVVLSPGVLPPLSVGTAEWDLVAFLIAAGPLVILVATLFYTQPRQTFRQS